MNTSYLGLDFILDVFHNNGLVVTRSQYIRCKHYGYVPLVKGIFAENGSCFRVTVFNCNTVILNEQVNPISEYNETFISHFRDYEDLNDLIDVEFSDFLYIIRKQNEDKIKEIANESKT